MRREMTKLEVELITREYQQSQALQLEFTDVATYLAWAKARFAGLIRNVGSAADEEFEAKNCPALVNVMLSQDVDEKNAMKQKRNQQDAFKAQSNG